MENYVDYLRCGEIYKAPQQSNKSPYILKCFRCTDVFMLLESFIFHIENYCKLEASTTATNSFKNELVEEEQQTHFHIDMVEGEYEGHEQMEYSGHVVAEYHEEEVLAAPSQVANEEIYFTLQDTLGDVKEETIDGNDIVCVVADDGFIAEEVVAHNECENEADAQNANDGEEIQHISFQDLSEDTESADEDPIPKKVPLQDTSQASPFILNFLASEDNALTLIKTYKAHSVLWNRKINPYSEKQYRRHLESCTKELNFKLKLEISSATVLDMITYLCQTYNEDLTNLKDNVAGKKYKPSWYMRHLSFLKPFVETNIFSNGDKTLPYMIPEQILQFIEIYKEFPQLWDTNLVEYCCRNKRSEYEVQMLKRVETQLHLKISQKILQKYLRCLHNHFSKIQNNLIADGDETCYFKHLAFLENHVGPLDCPECHQQMKSPFFLKTHMAKHNNSMAFTCSMCSKEFMTIAAYVPHARRHMNDFSGECEECGKKFIHASQLETHMKTHSCLCDICGCSFKNIETLMNHKKSHDSNSTFSCRICAKTYCSKASLDNHMARSHSNVQECKICGKRFNNQKSLQLHEAQHPKALKRPQSRK